MFGGVGFRNPTLSDYAIVDESNVGSTSGLYFNDASNFCTIQNIKDCQEDKDITDEEFNTYLTNLHKSAIDDVCRQVVAGKSDLVQSVNLYPYEKLFSSTLTPGDRFVALEIDLIRWPNIIAKIDFLELCFDGDITLNLFLYNSNLNDPIKTKECDCTGGQSTIIPLSDWFIADDTTYKGGKFYIGYFESDLGTVKPYAKEWEDSNEKVNTRYFTVSPVSFTLTNSEWDVSTREYDSDTFGMNIGVNIYNDYTELLIRNKELIFPAIQYAMVAKILDLIRTTGRSNKTQRFAKEMIEQVEFEIYGNKGLGIDGVNGKLNQTVENIRKALFFQPLIMTGTLT